MSRAVPIDDRILDYSGYFSRVVSMVRTVRSLQLVWSAEQWLCCQALHIELPKGTGSRNSGMPSAKTGCITCVAQLGMGHKVTQQSYPPMPISTKRCTIACNARQLGAVAMLSPIQARELLSTRSLPG